MTDDTLARLMTFGNVLVTGHQAFFTKDAFLTITDFEERRSNENVLRPR